jgi:hypothetical protein
VFILGGGLTPAGEKTVLGARQSPRHARASRRVQRAEVRRAAAGFRTAWQLVLSPHIRAAPRAELACLRDRRAKTLAWRARKSRVSYLHRGLQARARRARVAISIAERRCGIAFPAKCPEPHSGGAGHESRKHRLFLNLQIPYFPHFTRRPPQFPQNSLSFLPFPTRGIRPCRAPESVSGRAQAALPLLLSSTTFSCAHW